MLGYALCDEEICQLLCDLMRGDLSFDCYIQSLPGVFVQYVQHPEGLSLMGPRRHKIITPHMVLILGSQSDAGTLIEP